jgi:hypothetical protein
MKLNSRYPAGGGEPACVTVDTAPQLNGSVNPTAREQFNSSPFASVVTCEQLNTSSSLPLNPGLSTQSLVTRLGHTVLSCPTPVPNGAPNPSPYSNAQPPTGAAGPTGTEPTTAGSAAAPALGAGAGGGGLGGWWRGLWWRR